MYNKYTYVLYIHEQYASKMSVLLSKEGNFCNMYSRNNIAEVHACSGGAHVKQCVQRKGRGANIRLSARYSSSRGMGL